MRWWLSFVVWAGFSCLALAQPERGPAGDWVLDASFPPKGDPEAVDTDELLFDQQTRVGPPHITYVRRAYKVLSHAGAQNRARISIDYEPEDRLVWHFVRRTRDGQTQALLDGLQIRDTQPEDELDRGVYQGTRRAIVFIEDVRKGDVYDYAFSWEEMDAAVAGKYAASTRLGRSYGVGRFRVRVLAPEANVTFRLSAGEPTKQTATELVVDRAPLSAVPVEPDEPGWYDDAALLQASQFASWGDVVAWALPLYTAAAAALPPEAGELIERLRAEPEAERLRGAVRFVQDEVRYLSLSEGVHGLIPHAAVDTFSKRFGDCKDKAALLVALLRELGFESYPALVHTSWGPGLDAMLPTPYAFDHVVVYVEGQGGGLWVDPTRSFQGGAVADDPPLPFGFALRIAPGNQALTPLPTRALPDPELRVSEHFVVKWDRTATLRTKTVYRGARANGFRAHLAGTPRREIENRYLDFYTDRHGKLEQAAPLQIRDDEQANEITVRESYALADFWKGDQHDLTAWAVADELASVAPSRELKPLELAHPTHVRHEIEVDYPRGWEIVDHSERIDSDSFTYSRDERVDDRKLWVAHSYRSKRDHVPANQIEAYAEDVGDVQDNLAYAVVPDSDGPAGTGQLGFGFVLLALLAYVGYRGLRAAGGAVRQTLGRGRSRQPVHGRGPQPGESAATAITVRSATDLREWLEAIRCCGAEVFGGEGQAHAEAQRARYDGAELHVLAGRCPRCQRRHSRYFALDEG